MIITRDKKVTIFVLGTILLLVGVYTGKLIYDKKHEVNEATKNIFADSTDSNVFYTDIQGNQISLEQYLGKILVVTSWASWSPFSQTELTTLSELSKNYSQEEVVFLAINRKETREQAERYVKTVPDLNPTLILVLDTRDHFYTSIGGYAMPETVIYDKKGNIVDYTHGTMNQEQIKNKIDSLLNN